MSSIHESELLSHSAAILNLEETFQLKEKEKIYQEELEAYLRSKEWSRDVLVLLRNSVQHRLHARLCKEDFCTRICLLVVFFGDSSLVRMVNALSREQFLKESVSETPTVFIKNEFGTCHNYEDESETGNAFSADNLTSFPENVPAAPCPTLPPPPLETPPDSLQRAINHNSDIERFTFDDTPCTPATEILFKDGKPLILGTTNYTFPKRILDEKLWCEVKQLANLMLEEQKDETFMGMSLAKKFFTGYFTEEEILNCSQRKQRLNRTKKQTREFDAVKKELVFSATAFLMKNPQSTAAEFVAALQSQSESVKLKAALRKHLHLRIFSKYALDVRTRIEKKRERVKSLLTI